MIPHEKALVERMKDKPFALIGINSDPAERAKRRLADDGITWRNAIEGGTNGPLATKWKVIGWPTSFVLDAKGVIRYRDVQEKSLDAAVDALIKEMAERK